MRLSVAPLGAILIAATTLSGAWIVLPVASAQEGVFPKANVCGVAFDENGHAAPLVRVSAFYLGGQAGMKPEAVTDAAGHYCLLDVPGGPNVISADDPAKGCPSLLGLYSSTKRPTATNVPRDGTQIHVDVHIPYKAAILHVQLTDADTGQPLSSMMYKLWLRSEPKIYLQGSSASTERLLLPAHHDVYLTITGPGYQPGTSPNQYHLLSSLPGSGIHTGVPDLHPATGEVPPRLLLNLPSGAIYTLAVALHRVP